MDYLNYNNENSQLVLDKVFFTPLWSFVGNKLPKDIDKWAFDYMETHPSTIKSNRNGYQSPQRPIDEFPYKDYLLNKLKSEFSEFHITGWWVNINPKGGYNTQHTHPGCDLAAVWYITDNHGLLFLHDTSINSRSVLFSQVMAKYNESLSKTITAKKGDILVFPADLPHHVEEHTLDESRISVSFNMSHKCHSEISELYM